MSDRVWPGVIRARVVHPHTDTAACNDRAAANGWRSPWYLNTYDGSVHCDSIGRRIGPNGSRWLLLRCNFPDCPGEARVNEMDVADVLFETGLLT